MSIKTRCCIAGCHRPRGTRYSIHCDAHLKAQRRHGDPLQRGLSKASLKPFIDRVTTRWMKEGSGLNWFAIEERWQLVVKHAESIEAHFMSGKAGYRHHREAAQAILKIAQDVTAKEVVTTIAAVYLFERAFKGFFASDKSFRYQLVRTVRRLTRTNAGSWFSYTDQRVKLVYRDLPPRAVEYLASLLVEAFGPVGVTLQHMEDREEERITKAKTEFQGFLVALQETADAVSEAPAEALQEAS